jgi:opacity protein-like surface antigen
MSLIEPLKVMSSSVSKSSEVGCFRYEGVSMKRIMLALVAATSVVAMGAGEAAAHPAGEKSIVVAPHIGVTAPQLFSDLGSWPIFGLELGYIMPFNAGSFTRPLQLSFDVMYTAPGATGTGENLHLGEGGASYEWTLKQQMLVLQLGALWRFMPPGEFVSAYAMVGPRVYLMESVLNASGNGGADFGENRETNTEYGFVLGGGADFAVGPGTLFTTLYFSMSKLDQRITGEANTGALALSAGYRLYF